MEAGGLTGGGSQGRERGDEDMRMRYNDKAVYHIAQSTLRVGDGAGGFSHH